MKPHLFITVCAIIALSLAMFSCKKDEEKSPKNDKDVPVKDTVLSKSLQTFVVRGVEFQMAYVEAGTFIMGSNSPEAAENERPLHSVTLTQDFYIGVTEVTQALWEAVMGDNPSYFQGDYFPVDSVTWKDCQEFITKLNALTNKKFRLPTEAEWEYAARGGNRSLGFKYCGSNAYDSVAWCYNNYATETHIVASKMPNELGLYDMSGNVQEWCHDWFGMQYYSSSPQKNPQGVSSGATRVVRGGGWNHQVQFCRSSNRGGLPPDYADYRTGFRLLLPR